MGYGACLAGDGGGGGEALMATIGEIGHMDEACAAVLQLRGPGGIYIKQLLA